ncbi:MAG: hypothetical protein GXY61_14865 [Lentisphaerae bacterium]|nr:hypothetical protein [Lentisphaerota bacterium]
MIKTFIRLALIVTVVLLLLFGLIAACLLLANRDRQNVYVTQDIQGDRKTWFVEAFMPGVSPQDVLTLNYVRTGGREPIYFGVIEMTTNGVTQLRANSRHTGTGTFTHSGIEHLFSGQPEVIDNLAGHVKWWGMDRTQSFETRYVEWKKDHVSKFFIPTNGTSIYVEALIF